jgi:thiol-disulfide isomerase/thioredoxin
MLFSPFATAQPGTEYRGTLKPSLTAQQDPPDGLPLKALTEAERSALPIGLQSQEGAFGGKLRWAGPKADGTFRPTGDGPRLVLVEPSEGSPFALVDLNNDDTLRTDEKVAFGPGRNDDELCAMAWIKSPSGFYREYPFLLTLQKSSRTAADKRYLRVSMRRIAEGIVDVGDRRVLIHFAVKARDGAIDPRLGWLGMDSNGDGMVDGWYDSAECAIAEDEDIVFRVDSRYFSVKAVDQKAGVVTLREHPASDFVRVEMTVGTTVPDFSFVDHAGTKRRLSDFRGKYVLLDFWGTWCGPCVAQFPFLKTAYERFRNRGLEVLGIDFEQPDTTEEDLVNGLANAKKIVAEKGANWTHATPASSKDLYARRFRITAYPTIILLGPDRKIVSVGGDLPLKDEGLLKTLDQVLPPESPSRR